MVSTFTNPHLTSFDPTLKEIRTCVTEWFDDHQEIYINLQEHYYNDSKKNKILSACTHIIVI